MITYIDTDEVRAKIAEAKMLQIELREAINNLYNRLENVPDDTQEWVGQKAIYYFNIVTQDKIPLEAFCDSLEKLNYQIENNMNEAETIIRG